MTPPSFDINKIVLIIFILKRTTSPMQPGELKKTLTSEGFTIADLRRASLLSLTTLRTANERPTALKEVTWAKIHKGLQRLRAGFPTNSKELA